MKTGLITGVVVLSAALAVAALAQTAPPSGYLAAASMPDATKILPAPPPVESGRGADDRSIFVATRSLLNGPRGALATSDANLVGAAMYACALGAQVDARSAPALNALLFRAAMDEGRIINPPKNHYNRQRPYLVVPVNGGPVGAAPICVPKTEGLAKNGSYPSGHSALSWTWGLILADLAPDRATQVLARARSIGESRVVCGVHYASDIEAGRTTGAALFAALQSSPDFRADLERARIELAALRKTAPAPANCAVQDEAAAHSPY